MARRWPASPTAGCTSWTSCGSSARRSCSAPNDGPSTSTVGTSSSSARAAKAAGEKVPGFEQLQQAFDERFDPKAFADTAQAGSYQKRSRDALRSFYERELKSAAQAVGLERYFVLELEAPDGGESIRVNGVIDRIERDA